MFALLLLGATASVAEQPDVAVLEMTIEAGVSSGVGKLLSERLMAEVDASGHFAAILGASDIQEMLDLEQQKTALGCGDTGCLAQIGGALGVPYLLTSSVGRVGSRLMLNIKLLEVEEARVAARQSTLFADEDALVDGLSTEIDALLARAFPDVKRAVPAVPAAPPTAIEQTTPRRPYSISGLALIATGYAAFEFLAPGAGEMTAGRNSYDQARTIDDLNQASDRLTELVDEYTAARSLAIGLTTVGAVLNAWAFWRAR